MATISMDYSLDEIICCECKKKLEIGQHVIMSQFSDREIFEVDGKPTISMIHTGEPYFICMECAKKPIELYLTPTKESPQSPA